MLLQFGKFESIIDNTVSRHVAKCPWCTCRWWFNVTCYLFDEYSILLPKSRMVPAFFHKSDCLYDLDKCDYFTFSDDRNKWYRRSTTLERLYSQKIRVRVFGEIEWSSESYHFRMGNPDDVFWKAKHIFSVSEKSCTGDSYENFQVTVVTVLDMVSYWKQREFPFVQILWGG